LLVSVREAFAYAMDRMLIVSGAIAAIGIVIALVGLPRRPPATSPAPANLDDRAESAVDVVV
jgi:hypothetical protein